MSGVLSKKVHLGCDYVRNIGYMEEILVKILSKLPVDCLLEFKLVSKFWYKLIREKNFAQLQFSCAPRNPKLIMYLGGHNSMIHKELHLMDSDGEVRKDVPRPNLEDSSSFKLLCSFNGLVFCTRLVGDDELAIQVFNPVTQEVVEIPERSPSEITESVAVLFDPEKNRYKIFRFLFHESKSEDSNCCKCEVYTPDSGEWRKFSGIVKGPVVNPACRLFPTHVCVGGRMYWLVWSEEDIEVPGYILSIDMDDNITRVELPKFLDHKGNDIQILNILTFLTEYEGSLACVGVDNDEIYVDIWLLTDHSESSWSLKGSGELQIGCTVDAINSIVSINGELLFIIRPGIARYFCFHFLNPEEGTWRKSNERKFKIRKCAPIVLPYTESLFRCDLGNNTLGKRILGGDEK